MIESYKNLPKVYFDESRDFQTLGRLCDLISNSLKADTWKSIYRSHDSNILLLLSKTLGFDGKHHYTLDDMYNLMTSFVYLTKRKGTKDAIEMAGDLLLRSQADRLDLSVDDHEVIVERLDDESNPNFYYIGFPTNKVVDLVLFDDLMDYLLPAGALYEVGFYKSYDADTIELTNGSKIKIEHLSKNKVNLSRIGIIESNAIKEIGIDSSVLPINTGDENKELASEQPETEAPKILTGNLTATMPAPRESDISTNTEGESNE